MSAPVWTLAGVDLATYNARIVEHSGLFDLIGLERDALGLRGRDLLTYISRRRQYPEANLTVVVNGANHAEALANWQAFKALVSPALGWQELTCSLKAGMRLLVRSLGAPLPVRGAAALWFPVSFTVDRYPFWEGEALTVSCPTGGTIYNPGDIAVEPVYTIAFSGASTGFDFSIGGYRVDWNGTGAAGKELVVDVLNRTMVYDGASDIFNQGANTSIVWPSLAAGSNTLTVNGGTNYTFEATFRPAYE
jgi:hypothetical protein